jgi:hypothetical protein
LRPTLLARQAARPTSQSGSRYSRHHRGKAREPRDLSSTRSREGCRSFAGEGAWPASRMSGIEGPCPSRRTGRRPGQMTVCRGRPSKGGARSVHSSAPTADLCGNPLSVSARVAGSGNSTPPSAFKACRVQCWSGVFCGGCALGARSAAASLVPLAFSRGSRLETYQLQNR